MNELNEYELEEIERLKLYINSLDDYRQVEAIYDYCFEILNESGIYELKKRTIK